MTLQPEDVPVLFLGFNRPDKAARVLEPVRRVRPRRVFIAVDGPRDGRADEPARCRETQRAFENGVDWPCEVHKLYRETNLGCRVAVSSAITWALEQVEHCVIIEDDCVIQPDFLKLCAVLLPRHAEDQEVMNISAASFQPGVARGDGDYYPSKYAHCWGWATWRRAWQHYRDDLSGFEPVLTDKTLHKTEDEQAYWQIIYQRCVAGEVNSWAYRWMFSCWLKRGVGLIPNVNMVTNVGFTDDGTHTTAGDSKLGPLGLLEGHRAPSSLEANAEADDFTFRNVFCPPLSHAERQVFQHRIKALKAEIKELRAAKKSEPAKPGGLRRLFGGLANP